MKYGFNLYRHYCKAIPEVLSQHLRKPKLEYTKLHHVSKVPNDCIKPAISRQQTVHIDLEIIQSLERLSLVNLDGEEALRNLGSSIQFAENISKVNTDNIEPLYTVLYNHPLRLRKDVVGEGNCRESILQNSEVTDEDYFISPPGNIPLQQ